MGDRHRHREERRDHGVLPSTLYPPQYRGEYDNRRGSDGGRDYYRQGSGGRGGSGYDQRPQHQQKRRYQSSFVGQKRGREEAEVVDPRKQFVRRLMRLGEPGPMSESDKTTAGDTPEKTIDNAWWALKQEIKHETENLVDIVLDAVLSCSHKTLHYALLLGLLNGENPDWVRNFTAAAGQRFEHDLHAGGVVGPRLLLRLFACLTHTSVLHPNDVLGLMERTVDVAVKQATAGADPSGLTWQPWCDQLVYAVLGALVWGGAALKAAAPDEHEALMLNIQQYMVARPIQESVELRPMYGASDAADAAAASDSGGASFLGQLWHAAQALRQEPQAPQQQDDIDPNDPDAPQHHDDPEATEQQLEIQGIPMQLVAAFSNKLKGQAVELPPIRLPDAVPGVDGDAAEMGPVGRAEVAVKLQDRYPARGGIRILELQYTDGSRSPLDRFVAEEMIIDLLVAFDAHRVELAQMLCSGLPLPYDYSGLLCETLFAQLLRLPHARLNPVAFSALIANTALLRPAFPRYLAGSVRQLYLRLQFLAPELAGRLADVLAHFISNMSFRWPWDKYRMGLSQPSGGPQRAFLVAVLHDLVKLTSWDHQLLLQETPAEFLALLGGQPGFAGLPVPVPYPPPAAPPVAAQQLQLQSQQDGGTDNGQDEKHRAAQVGGEGGDEQMADVDVPAAAATDGPVQETDATAGEAAGPDEAMQQDEQQQPQLQSEQQAAEDAGMMEADGGQPEQQEPEVQDPEMLWAGRLLGVMQSRPPPEHKPLTSDQVIGWIDREQMAQQLGSPEVHLRAVFRAVLAAASKSCSHCYVLIERFSPYLLMVMQQLPEQQQQQEDAGEQGKTGQEVLLDTLGEMYSHMPRRIDLALGRLHELLLVSPVSSVQWLIASPALEFGPASNEAAAADAWHLLDSIIAGTLSRYQGAVEQKARLEDAKRKARAKLTAASEESAAAAEAQQKAEDEAGGPEGGGDAVQDAAGDAARRRQAISWPGTGGRHGAAHRVEVAALREELMAKKLATAEELYSQQDELIRRLESAQGETLLAAFKGLIPKLLIALLKIAEQSAQAPADAGLDEPDIMAADGEDAEQTTAEERLERCRAEAAAAAESATRLCLVQMEGFSRLHRSEVVELGLTEQLVQHVDSLLLEHATRAAVLGPLHLL